ncbi:Uncharacterised protein [Chlamydia trachomatis]|nr:Uncharacterised protein [Chlamydia trachomatis]CRH61714.1 Uncharacterised protein [Chlamydia trachomatis]CRH87335.1 Uncharacterised protein [Chlamydia trachomatis]
MNITFFQDFFKNFLFFNFLNNLKYLFYVKLYVKLKICNRLALPGITITHLPGV